MTMGGIVYFECERPVEGYEVYIRIHEYVDITREVEVEETGQEEVETANKKGKATWGRRNAARDVGDGWIAGSQLDTKAT